VSRDGHSDLQQYVIGARNYRKAEDREINHQAFYFIYHTHKEQIGRARGKRNEKRCWRNLKKDGDVYVISPLVICFFPVHHNFCSPFFCYQYRKFTFQMLCLIIICETRRGNFPFHKCTQKWQGHAVA
jgi:hypothetical protein